MERIWKDIIKAAVIGFVVPAVLLSAVLALSGSEEASREPATSTTQPTHTAPVSTPSITPGTNSAPDLSQHKISVLVEQGVVEMELETYVLGVVLAEVPGSFAPEALKAQAVAARTFALYACQTKRHNGAVCTSYSCCQAYRSPEQYLDSGGTQQKLEKVMSAVEDTAGQVLTYGGKVICATYFACSGGMTEAAAEVWGWEIPYLQPVESPGEEFCWAFTDYFYFTAEDLQEALCVHLEGSPETWFGDVTYTAGGSVATLEIGGAAYRGTTLRKLLGLRSTVFTVTVEGDTVCFETRGYGHRVGMSQYGAQAMALDGNDYETILTHYYRGAELSIYGR